LIDEQRAGIRLDEFLASELVGLSRMRIANLIAAGACLVNSREAGPGYHLRPHDLIEFTIADGPPTSMDPEPIPLEILYEDSHLLVVVKPSGMLVHPTRSVKRGTLANALAYHLNFKSEISDIKSVVRPGIVHRLDRDTSGLMVVAKTQRALSILSRHFGRRLVRKRYIALVEGRILSDEGAISAPIGRDPDHKPHWRVMDDGKAAETRFRVLERIGDITIIELEPVTGRTNQLRIHCAWAGHAILGDRLYSSAPAERLCLHAAELAFHHPAGGEWMEFLSPLPPDITAVMSDER
jgi:23S rRNA pseudouridine1911/1915/1917 synthase